VELWKTDKELEDKMDLRYDEDVNWLISCPVADFGIGVESSGFIMSEFVTTMVINTIADL
jgi:protein-arginine kinase